MARVLMCWELGNGLAYLESQAVHARTLKEAGHEVLFACRNLRHAERLLGGKFAYYQAPTQIVTGGIKLPAPMTFADVLINLGYDDGHEITARVRGWRNLLDLLKPDVVRCANSPAALLAARGTGIRTLATGIGFTHPPAVSPLPNLRTWESTAVPEHMAAREAKVLDAMNQALDTIAATRLASVGTLYNEVDACHLYTYPELDDYGPRDGVRYMGNFQVARGETPVWPAVIGKRIFAYLEPFKVLLPLLEILAASGQPVLVYMPRAPEELRTRYAGQNLRLTDRPLDLNETAAQCDIGVSQGGHNIAGTLMRAGKPQLCVPNVFPERIVTEKLVQLGVALMTRIQAEEVKGKLVRLLEEPNFTTKAQEVGRHLAHYTVETALRGTVETVKSLVKG